MIGHVATPPPSYGELRGDFLLCEGVFIRNALSPQCPLSIPPSNPKSPPITFIKSQTQVFSVAIFHSSSLLCTLLKLTQFRPFRWEHFTAFIYIQNKEIERRQSRRYLEIPVTLQFFETTGSPRHFFRKNQKTLFLDML